MDKIKSYLMNQSYTTMNANIINTELSGDIKQKLYCDVTEYPS